MHYWREVVLNNKTSVELCDSLSEAKASVALCVTKKNKNLHRVTQRRHRETQRRKHNYIYIININPHL